MLKNEREALEKEISEIWNKAMKYSYGYFEDDELQALREALQPAVDGWNDGEDEYQHMVDILGGGIEEYNYDQYIPNIHETKLVDKLNKMNISTYHYFMPTETMNMINQVYVEHKTGCVLDMNYDKGVIIVTKTED